jgi:hypothetical protein
MTVEKIGTLLVWPESDNLWRYLPLAPVPQRNEAGRPMVTVMEAGGMVMLTIGARLEATEADLAAARKVIAAKTGQAGVDLRPATAAVTAASLRLVATDKTETELAVARPSNLPPYTAAFSAMVQGDQAQAVKDALPAGRVIVRYQLGLPRKRAVTAELAGPWDGSGRVADALARGELRLRTMADDGASEALIKRAVDKVMAEAAHPPLGQGGTCATRSATYVEATETETETEDMTLDAALAGWIN